MITTGKIRKHNNLNTPVSEVMIQDVIKVEPNESILDVLKLVNTTHINHIPVVEGNKLVGAITPDGLISALSHQYIDENGEEQ